jgi:hypothetical protein
VTAADILLLDMGTYLYELTRKLGGHGGGGGGDGGGEVVTPLGAGAGVGAGGPLAALPVVLEERVARALQQQCTAHLRRAAGSLAAARGYDSGEGGAVVMAEG